MSLSVKRVGFAIAVLVLLVGSASAGALNGNAFAILSGNHVFAGAKAQMSANVDYAVFNPGVFTGALGLPPAEDPSGGTEYVYAYEVFNTGASLLSFSVGLKPNVITAATNFGDAPSAGGVAPTAGFSGFIPTAAAIGDKTNIRWQFFANIANGAHSNYLLFTSPFGPGLDLASLVATVGDTNPPNTDFLPSPVPEPSTLALAGVAICGLLTAGYARRRKV
jgi:hypothetical protein